MSRIVFCNSRLLIAIHRAVLAIVFATLIGPLATSAPAKKTDVAVMDNGNQFVGEIKLLEYGLLNLSLTDVKGWVRVEWDHVVRLTSSKQLDIVLRSGQHYFGSLVESSADGILHIQTVFGEVAVDRSDVVNIEPIKATIWQRLSADVSTGISFTKATDIVQFNFGGVANYRTVQTLTILGLNTIITAKSGDTKTNTDFPLTHFRYYENKWFLRGETGGNRNDELGIDFRGSLAAGGGRRLVHSNSALVQVSVSLSANREFTSDGLQTSNLELVLDTTLMAFRYDTPKLEFNTELSVFVNLTTQDRYRVSLDGRVSLELVEDLFWDIGQAYYRFDSDPSKTAASQVDWGVVSGLRYKFN